MRIVSYVMLLGAFTCLTASGQPPSADLILFNGRVFTADPRNPFAEAVAIRSERILAVGSSEE